jgi:hypothetical protein
LLRLLQRRSACSDDKVDNHPPAGRDRAEGKEMKRVAFLVILIAIGWLFYETEWQPTSKELPPAFKEYMDLLNREVDADWNGPAGEEARVVCRRIAGISEPVKTSIDVLRAGYNKETADRYTDCLGNYMYPVPAKKK